MNKIEKLMNWGPIVTGVIIVIAIIVFVLILGYADWGF